MAAPAVAVVINNTRVVLEETNAEATVQVRNVSDGPVLLQVWIDDGDMNAGPQQAASPFVLTPPVARVDSQRGQAIRILKAGDVPNRQQETLFWLNVLEIPPKATSQLAAGENLLQFSFRTRIKLFYRPAGLIGGAGQAHEQLCFAHDATSQHLIVYNPSPFYITFRSLVLHPSSNETPVNELGRQDERMVAPASELRIPLSRSQALPVGTVVRYSIINDYGGDTHGQRNSQESCLR